MTTPSGAISFENIRSEFGRPQANNSLSNYYSNGPALGAPLANVPSSGQISMSQLKSTAKVSANGDRVNIASYVNSGESIVFFSNGTIYSNTTGTAALRVPSSRTGATSIIIGHTVNGRGGQGGSGQPVTDNGNSAPAPAGSAGNGSGGGGAISIESPCFVDNNSNVSGGGGGGGGGSSFGGTTPSASNGITCTSTTLKGITSNTNGNTAFMIGTGGAGGGGGGGISGGPTGNVGGGGHATNFANGNRTAVTAGTQCTSNSSYFNGRIIKMVSNQGNFSNTVGASGGNVGNGGGGRTGTSGTENFPTISDNGNSTSSAPVNGNGDSSSAGGAGYSYFGYNTYNTTVHGIGSDSGSKSGNFS